MLGGAREGGKAMQYYKLILVQVQFKGYSVLHLMKDFGVSCAHLLTTVCSAGSGEAVIPVV